MSNLDLNTKAIISAITELTRTFKQSSAFDSQLGAARASRTNGRKGGTEHKQYLPDEEFRMRHHFIDNLRSVQTQEVKERQKLAKRIADEEKMLSKIVRKHSKANSEASKNLESMRKNVADMNTILQKSKESLVERQKLYDKETDAIEQRVKAMLRSKNDLQTLSSQVEGAAGTYSSPRAIAQLHLQYNQLKELMPNMVTSDMDRGIGSLTNPATRQAMSSQAVDANIKALSSSLVQAFSDSLVAISNKRSDDENTYKRDMKKLNAQQAQYKQNIMNHFGTIDAITKIEGDLAAGLGQFADMFGKDKRVVKYSEDAAGAITAFRKNLENLANATDPKDIKNLDKLVQNSAEKVFDGVRRYELRIAKLRNDDNKRLFADLRDKLGGFLVRFGDGVSDLKKDFIGTTTDLVGSGIKTVLNKIGSALLPMLGKMADAAGNLVMKELIPDRLALMKYGTFMTPGGKGDPLAEWIQNMEYAGKMGIKSTDLAQLRAEQRSLLLTSSGGEQKVLTSIGDIVHGITRGGANDVNGTSMGQYFGGSSRDRIDASLAGLNMLRDAGLTSSFENLSNVMEKNTITNQNLTGLTQQQLFTYAGDIMNMSENQELLSGASETQRKAMMSNTFRLQEVGAGLGYNVEQTKAMTEELVKMRKGMSGEDKLKSLATVPMMGSMMGLDSKQMNVLRGAAEANARGGTALETFMTPENAAIMKQINTQYQQILAGDGSPSGLMNKILFEKMMAKMPEVATLFGITPASAKAGVNKNTIAGQQRMVDGTPGENTIIMSLNATLDSFNNGLLHGASGAGMFVQAMQDLPEQLSIGGTSISTALSTVAGVFSDFANAIGLGRFTRTANENQLLLENANESSNLEKFLGQVKDSRKLVGYGSGSSFDRARQMVGMGGSSAQYDYSNDQQRIANVYYKYHGKDSGALKGMGSFTQDPSKKGYIKWSDAGMSREQKAQALSKMFTQLQQDLVTKQQEAKDREDKLLQTFDDALGENTKATILNTGALDRNTKPDVGPITLEDRMEQGRKKYTGVADAKQSQHAKSAK